MAFIYYAIVITILLYWIITKNFNHWKDKNVHFIKPLPIVGNTINGVLMRMSFGELFHDFYQKTKEPILGLFIFNTPCLLIRDPQIIKRILVSDFQYFYDRNVLNNKRDDPIGTFILFFLKNPDWREMRTKITPVYSSAKIKAMSSLIEHAAFEMTDYLVQETKNRSVIEMKEIAVKFTVNVITSTAFGVNANSFKNEKSQFYIEAKRMFNWDDFLTAFRIRSYFLAHTLVKIFRIKLFHPTSIKFLEENFWKIMDQRAVSKTRRNDLIDILLEMKNNKQLLDRDILTSQAVMFFAAGFETSSSTLGFALHEIAFHPDVQTKLRNEINEVSKKYGGINHDSLKDMEYLDMVVQETLRKYPVVPVLERKCNTRYTIPETGTVIEKDTPVFIPAFSLHYDPQYFSDPEEFIPERFAAENKHLLENFSYLPFGDGPRNCIGARFGKLTVKTGLLITFNPNGFVLGSLNGIKLKVKKIEK